jgi:hypothetical protein
MKDVFKLNWFLKIPLTEKKVIKEAKLARRYIVTT